MPEGVFPSLEVAGSDEELASTVHPSNPRDPSLDTLAYDEQPRVDYMVARL